MNNFIFGVIFAGPIIVIVSWAIGENLVYFGAILVGSMIVIVFWAIEKINN